MSLFVGGVFLFGPIGCEPPTGPNNPQPDNSEPEFAEIQPEITEPVPATGRVRLPDGSGLSLQNLRVITNAAETPVDADGNFTASVISNVPSLTPLVNEDDVAVLLAFVGGTIEDSEISAKSTAEVLLYLAIGGWTIPADRFPELLYHIANSQACNDLAGAVETAIAANATALLDGDQSLSDAIETAADAFMDSFVSTQSSKAGDPSSRKVRIQAPQGGPFLMLNPDEGEEQSGLTTVITTDSRIQFSNTLARAVCLYVFQTAYTDAEGNRVELSPVEQFGAPIDLPAATVIPSNIRISE
ncbi:MAG: hypothetical protein KDA54_07000, partial [Phycisphaerales bacterium]|nr:hypothetical protein [Phycisphaerales bacterium]